MNMGVYVVKTIKIKCKSAIELDLDELHVLQKDLKSLSQNDYQKYKKEIDDTGYAFPIKAWLDPEDKWQIVGGTQSYRTLLQMRDHEGYIIPKIPVSIIEADNLRQACHRVLQDASNYGKVEKEGLYEFMQMAALSVGELKARFSPTDIDMDEFEQEFFDLENEAGKAEIEDDIPEQVEPKTKIGDLYALGNHRLLCGDSTDFGQVERLMNGEKADLWLTDPPYGVSYQSNGAEDKHEKIENDDLPIEEMAEFWTKVASNALEFCSNKASYYWFACGGDQMMMMMMSIGRANWKVRHELIWVKDSLVMGRCDYHYKHEPILYGWKKDGTHEWQSDRKQTSVLEYPRPKKSEEHPTMKPVELIAYLMGNNTKQKQIVLDTFGGSGTTLIAAEKTNRKARLLEISPKYCDVIIARWEQYTGQKSVKLE